jgi:hypothetical protein
MRLKSVALGSNSYENRVSVMRHANRILNGIVFTVALFDIAACEKQRGDTRAADLDALRSTDAGPVEGNRGHGR